MATDPRFAQSRFTTGVKRAATSDPRFAADLRSPKAGYASAAARRYSAEARPGDDAVRRKLFEQSAARQQYTKPVVVGKGRFAREE